MEHICLNNHVEIPQLGFGVFQITDQQLCEQSIRIALETGCRV